jgi:arsenate reductase
MWLLAQAHWGASDPAAVEGTLDDKRAAFLQACEQLEARITLFALMPVTKFHRDQLQAELEAIAEE